MHVKRASAIKLASFGGVTVVAAASHYFGLGEHAKGLLGATFALAGAGVHALFGHLGVHLVETISEHSESENQVHSVQNDDLHQLIGATIARILKEEARNAPGGKIGATFLKAAATAFRTQWMSVELIGPETALGE